MRSHVVVVETKCFDRALGVRQADEPARVQARIAQSPVEAFDETMLHGLAWLDELHGPAVLVRPLIHRCAAKFWSVVADHDLRVSEDLRHALQCTHDPVTG